MREVIRQHLEELPEAPVEIKNQFEGPITDLISSVSNTFVERIGNLQNVVGERQAEAKKELGKFDLVKAPPCFNLNLLDLQAGVNLAHPSRFFITTFLSSLNQDSESLCGCLQQRPISKSLSQDIRSSTYQERHPVLNTVHRNVTLLFQQESVLDLTRFVD